MTILTNLIGSKNNDLTVIGVTRKPAGINKKMVYYLVCKCVCGKSIVATKHYYVKGRVKSCGGKKAALMSIRAKTHGLHKHPLYTAYYNMKTRCYKTNNKDYHKYGGRGVTICALWLNNFMSFYEWAINEGWKPGLEIDKDIKGSGLIYSPEQCSVVSRKTNLRNTRKNIYLSIDGETKCLSEWSEISGNGLETIRYRISKGISHKVAVWCYDYKEIAAILGRVKSIKSENLITTT